MRAKERSSHPDIIQKGSPSCNIQSKLLLLIFLVLLDVACAVFSLEPLYPPGRIDIFLLARVKWMAHRADFCVYLFYRAAGLKRIATAAVDHYFFILWMNIFFHNSIAPNYLKRNILTVFRHISTKIFAIRHFLVETSLCGVFIWQLTGVTEIIAISIGL